MYVTQQIIFLVVVCVKYCLAVSGGQYDLIAHLFTNYTKSVKPLVGGKAVQIVAVLNPALYNIISLNGNMQQLTYTMWYRLHWTDPLLTWDPEKHNGIKMLKVPTHFVWLPDVTAVDVTDIKNEMPPDNQHVVAVSNTGRITFLRLLTVTVHCDLNLRMFPFDQQNCTVLFGSWLYTQSELAVFAKTPTDYEFYKESTEWSLVSYTARNSSKVYGTDSEKVSDVFYDIVIKRKSFFYVSNYALPTFAITALTIIGLFSPFNNLTERQEKVTMGLTALLTISVMLLKIQTEMPTSENVPMLGLYEMLGMLLCGIATIFAVFIMYLDNSLALGKVPKWFYNLITAGMNLNDKGETSKLDSYEKWARKISKQPHIQQIETKEMLRVRPYDLEPLEDRVHGILKITTMIRRRLAEIERKEATRRKGVRICRQMDDYMMAIFLLIDIVITIAFLVIGYCFA